MLICSVDGSSSVRHFQVSEGNLTLRGARRGEVEYKCVAQTGLANMPEIATHTIEKRLQIIDLENT